jgi:YD repeat-containing protein
VYKRTDAKGNAVFYDYDNMNRINKVSFPDGTTFDYQFDSIGNPTKMTDPTGTVDYTYINGRPDTAAYSRNGMAVKYEQDSLGNLTKISALKGTDTIYSNQYRYNERNQVDMLTDANNGSYNFGYDDVGNFQQILYPNTTTAVFDYDKANRVKTITNSVYGGAPFLSYSYEYDSNGRRNKMITNGTEVTDYNYDDIGQLNYVSDSRGITNYEYDGAGNRAKVIAPSGTTDYIYDKPILDSDGALTPTES